METTKCIVRSVILLVTGALVLVVGAAVAALSAYRHLWLGVAYGLALIGLATCALVPVLWRGISFRPDL